MGLTNGFGVAGAYLKGAQFEQGLTVTIEKAPEMVEASEGFGFKDGEFAGKQLRFYFILDGDSRYYDATSVRLISAMDPFNVGDTVLIKRSGTAMKTEWTAKKVDAPAAKAVSDEDPI